MTTKNRGRLHAVIDARLCAIATSLREPPCWNEPRLRLGQESTWEERLSVCQAIRRESQGIGGVSELRLEHRGTTIRFRQH